MRETRDARRMLARFGGERENVDACVVVLVIDIDNDNVSLLLLFSFSDLNKSLRFIFSSR
jgi:hypothetical protein